LLTYLNGQKHSLQSFPIQMRRGTFTAISSSHASNDVLLSCYMKTVASPVSLTDKQPEVLNICDKSCYCSFLNQKQK